MKELTNRKSIIIISLTLVILMIFYIGTYYSDGIYHNRINCGANIFYTFNSFLPFYLLLAFLSGNLVVSNFYQNKYSKFQNMIITRVGAKKRIFYEIKKVIYTSIIFRLLIHIISLLVIHIFFSKIHFVQHSNIEYYASSFVALSSNPTVSLILYIIYSTIGFCVFSLFIYGFIYFVKNRYVYKVSGIILYVGLVVFAAIIGNQLYVYFSDIKFSNPFLQAINTSSLLIPGLETATSITSILETNVYSWYTCIMFLIYSGVFSFIRWKMERKNG